MSSRKRYLHIERWDDFQHYKDGREPTWIKQYVRQLDDTDAYLRLTPYERALLHDLRMAYATTRRQLIDSTTTISRYIGYRVRRASLERLKEAGFISYSSRAGVPISTKMVRKNKKEEEEPKLRVVAAELPDGPLAEEVKKAIPFNPIVRRSDQTSPYTGCTIKRGPGGTLPVRDALGIDRPPRDWPWPAPTNTEIIAARRERAA